MCKGIMMYKGSPPMLRRVFKEGFDVKEGTVRCKAGLL